MAMLDTEAFVLKRDVENRERAWFFAIVYLHAKRASDFHEQNFPRWGKFCDHAKHNPEMGFFRESKNLA